MREEDDDYDISQYVKCKDGNICSNDDFKGLNLTDSAEFKKYFNELKVKQHKANQLAKLEETCL